MQNHCLLYFPIKNKHSKGHRKEVMRRGFHHQRETLSCPLITEYPNLRTRVLPLLETVWVFLVCWHKFAVGTWSNLLFLGLSDIALCAQLWCLHGRFRNSSACSRNVVNLVPLKAQWPRHFWRKIVVTIYLFAATSLSSKDLWGLLSKRSCYVFVLLNQRRSTVNLLTIFSLSPSPSDMHKLVE